MDLERLVNLVVAEVLWALGRAGAGGRRRLLAVVTGNPADPGILAAQFQRLRAGGRFESTLLFSRTAGARLPTQELGLALGARPVITGEPAEAVPVLVHASDLVMVPWLSLNGVAKLAAGICDTPALAAVMLALLHGRPVVACAEEADPDSPCLSAWARPAPALAERLRANLRALQAYGADLVPAARLAEAVLSRSAAPLARAPAPDVAAAAVIPAPAAGAAASAAAPGPGRRVITQADVMAVLAAGQPPAWPEDSILTPLAREALTRLSPGAARR